MDIQKLQHLLIPDKYTHSLLLIHPDYPTLNTYNMQQAYRISFADGKINSFPSIWVNRLIFSLNSDKNKMYMEYIKFIKSIYPYQFNLGNFHHSFYESVYKTIMKREKREKVDLYLPEPDSEEIKFLRMDQQQSLNKMDLYVP